jgi:hypothetical protein
MESHKGRSMRLPICFRGPGMLKMLWWLRLLIVLIALIALITVVLMLRGLGF